MDHGKACKILPADLAAGNQRNHTGGGVNYQTDGGTTLAPIRTGVGLRAGANLGYLHYTSEASWIPC